MRGFTIILLLTVFSCVSTRAELEYKNVYIERKVSFFDPNERIWINGKNLGHTYKHWVRKPENIRMLHETFKKLGYNNLVTNEERFSSIIRNGIFIQKPMNELLDSLIITYSQDTILSKYYREFWGRRKSENNELIVFEILTEMASELYEGHFIESDQEFVNDTLFNLVKIRDIADSITLKLGKQHYKFLKNIGMHQSAYNILFENSRYSHLNWNREELVKHLTIDTLNSYSTPWIEDNTK